jgi:hypothetical protein
VKTPLLLLLSWKVEEGADEPSTHLQKAFTAYLMGGLVGEIG